MKKRLFMVLLCVSVAITACGTSTENNGGNVGEIEKQPEISTTQAETPKRAVELLNEKEKELFEAILIMSDDFVSPSDLRILKIGDYKKRADKNKGNDVVVLKVQGKNDAGGTQTEYYVLVIKPGSAEEDPLIKDGSYTRKEWAQMLWGQKSYVNAYIYREGKAGDYYALENYEIEEEATELDVGRINNALTEYWEE